MFINTILLAKCLVKGGSADSLFCSVCYWFWLQKTRRTEMEHTRWIIRVADCCSHPQRAGCVDSITSLWPIHTSGLNPEEIDSESRMSILSRKLRPVLLSPVLRRCNKATSVIFTQSKKPRVKGRRVSTSFRCKHWQVTKKKMSGGWRLIITCILRLIYNHNE